MTVSPWWQDAVVYQVYPRSWADADGDGIGDLPGITARLPHLVELGVDALWLSPFYASPQRDGGYDVSDHRAVDPVFGDLADVDAMITRAHELGLKVVVDVVPNHTSSEHPWFRAALASAPGSRERSRYVFRDGRGDEPPNNWQSLFGGPAWTRVTEADGSPGQWYLHLFDTSQPDLDWTSTEVQDEMDDVLRFWLDRGVDGFRIDVADGMAKADGLPDVDLGLGREHVPTRDLPMWDQPAVHDVHRRWRRLVDEHGDHLLCAEAWVFPAEALALYVRPDELHQTFNFPFLMTPWIADELRSTITESLETFGPSTTWVLSNHDVVRHASRLGLPQQRERRMSVGIGPDDPQPDDALGLRRARAATAVMLALPGAAYVYQGEELGLPEATLLPDDVRQDPTFARTGGASVGRDGCRVPMPWEGDAPSYGFGPGDASWLPQPEAYGALAVDRQRGVAGSTYELYRTLLRVRREHRLGRGTLTWLDGFGDDVLAFTVGDVTVVANLGDEPVDPPPGRVLASTGDPAGPLGPDDALWLQR